MRGGARRNLRRSKRTDPDDDELHRAAEGQLRIVYTTGAAGYPGCTYINGGIGGKKDFSVIIQHAKRC